MRVPSAVADSLAAKDSKNYEMVLTNPPFGKKSSVTSFNTEGEESREALTVLRDDFWATTSNKQLNFVQHVHSMLKETGRAAVVVPDNVLFEGGAGEKIRRTLLERCEVHTLLRLPTGIWYSPGVKANVLFFDKKPVTETPATQAVWVYDLRSHRNLSLRQNPIVSDDLTDFVRCYRASDPTQREETEHFRRFSYSEIIARDKANLDITWRQETIGSVNGSSPQALMKAILEDLEEAMIEFAAAEREIRQ